MIPTDNQTTELQKAVETPRTDAAFRLGSAMDTTYEEMGSYKYFCRTLERELLSAAKQLSTLQSLSDLHRDEFKRILAIAADTEIQGLCDRAVTQIEQHVPFIVQRDSAVRQFLELQAELKQEKIWKEEDPRMLREQMRVHDVAFQHLHDQNTALQKENDELKRNIRAANFPKEQATTCGKCGVYKHTPWRDDEYGYVCATCLVAIKDDERDSLTAALKECAEAFTIQSVTRSDCEHFGIVFKEHECGCDVCATTTKLCPATQSTIIQEIQNKALSNAHVQKLLKP